MIQIDRRHFIASLGGTAAVARRPGSSNDDLHPKSAKAIAKAKAVFFIATHYNV